jgi:hypothetical protein
VGRKRPQKCVLLHPAVFLSKQRKVFVLNGGDDETRTRDLCRDRLELNGTDSSFLIL